MKIQDYHQEYLNINRDAWNKKAEVHYDSDFYRTQSFLDGENHLKQIEREILGDIRGKEILHLQCHFGLDTLSLARLGAEVCGVDISDVAIQQAKELARKSDLAAEFICSDVYGLPKVHNKKYDIIFSTYGTIGWLPDMNKWASVVENFLKPGGQLLLIEFHPFIWTFDDDLKNITFDYFNTSEIREIEKGSYSDRNAEIQTETVSWNHNLAEVISALLNKGLSISQFQEYDFSPHACFNNLRKDGENEYRFEHLKYKIPMVYSLLAKKGV